MEAVAVLEKAGRAARQAGALATAVSWLDTAVTMAGERVSVPLLMAQAEAQLASGRAAPAIAAYQLLLARPDLESPAKVETLWMLGRAFAAAGQHDRAATAFGEAASLARGDDPATAVEVLLDAAFCAELSAGPAPALVLASQARDLASSVRLTLRTRVEADWAQLALLCGNPAGIAAAETAASWHGDRFSGLTAEKTTWAGRWGPAISIAYSACFLERLAEAERVFALARAAAERAGVPDALAGLAAGHSYTLFRMGRLEESLAAIKVAVSLMELVPMMDAFASAGIASLCLYMGKLDESSQWCQRVETTATAREQPTARLFLDDVLGHRHLREGAIADACERYAQLETTVHRMGIGEPCAVPWPRHAMHAYLAAGHVDDAQRVLAWLDQAAARLPCRFPRIAAATGRAQLAELRGDRAGAEGHYRAALALHGETDLPVEHCETLLAYGGFLRRSGPPARARPVLSQAAEIAQRTGALWLADLAHQELKVAGGRRRHRAAPGVLSAQEERVAALVATGATNADIARQLYLSVSTVETHLERIYAKLGIHTRYQLIAMAAQRQLEP
jgi:DNA-binding CsgD family transcriptional regulator